MVQKPLPYMTWKVHNHSGAQQLHPAAGASCQCPWGDHPVNITSAIIFLQNLNSREENLQSFHLLFGITDNMETERLYRMDSEKYNQLLTTSCNCVSMGNKHQTCVFEAALM